MLKLFSVFSLFIIMMASCKSLNYYSSSSIDDVQTLIKETENYEPVIRVDDRISVSIWGHDNLSIGSVFGVYNSNEVFGKWILVEPDSTVTLPRIGKVKVAGEEISHLSGELEKKYSLFIKNPIVDIKVHSHEITVIGQVIKPGNYPVYKGKNTIAYMIAAAGGTDFYAQINKVKLVREDRSYLLNLSLLSPLEMNNIKLIPGDVLYFPTKNAKTLEKKSSVLIAFSSITTVMLLILNSRK